jgi:hypothetical protein
MYNKGPLFTTAMALFGGGSFLAVRIANPSAYLGIVYNPTAMTTRPLNEDACADLAPMGRLFGIESREYSINHRCIRNDEGGISAQGLSKYMGEWVLRFNATSDDDFQKLSNTFDTAAFLANQAFVMNTLDYRYLSRKLHVTQDPGENVIVPTMSLTGIIIVSTFLGAHILGLLLLALYATFSPRWADSFDGFTMMRIGAALAQRTSLPLAIGRKMDKIGILDEHPGRIGGSIGEFDEDVVRLELGGSAPINGESIYASYAGDSDLPERLAVLRNREQIARQMERLGRQRAAMAEVVRQREMQRG